MNQNKKTFTELGLRERHGEDEKGGLTIGNDPLNQNN